MSMRTTSGASRGICASASSALLHANTQRWPGAASIHSRNDWRMTALSSTMATEVIVGRRARILRWSAAGDKSFWPALSRNIQSDQIEREKRRQRDTLPCYEPYFVVPRKAARADFRSMAELWVDFRRRS